MAIIPGDTKLHEFDAPGRNVGFYSDRHSKVTGEDCVHIELRLMNTQSVRRAGYANIAKVIKLDPRMLFDHHLAIVDFSEKRYRAFKRRIIKGNRHMEGKRVNNLLDRIHGGRAMSVRNNHPNYIKNLPFVVVSQLISSSIEIKGEFRKGTSVYDLNKGRVRIVMKRVRIRVRIKLKVARVPITTKAKYHRMKQLQARLRHDPPVPAERWFQHWLAYERSDATP